MAKPKSSRHLYEIHTAPQPPLITEVLSGEQLVELVRLRGPRLRNVCNRAVGGLGLYPERTALPVTPRRIEDQTAQPVWASWRSLKGDRSGLGAEDQAPSTMSCVNLLAGFPPIPCRDLQRRRS